ncbi:hypothetical protein Ahy_B01g054751 [Arachis hypogaea]|uniref:Uncharacterized protein n=1 Tax=Arachis hypogaea TaxID=3818 RepID=A0A445AU95_ARAHY|nr:hypothetical protein Ahy_B01g054751 [Arachis hypogaea]
MLEQRKSIKGKSKPGVRSTAIDEFLKENGIDVKIEGPSTKLSDDKRDSLALNEDYYQHVMEDIDDEEGRVRCYGRSVTKSNLKKHAEISEIKKQHIEEVTSLKDELGDMKAKQKHQEEEIHGL